MDSPSRNVGVSVAHDELRGRRERRQRTIGSTDATFRQTRDRRHVRPLTIRRAPPCSVIRATTPTTMPCRSGAPKLFGITWSPSAFRRAPSPLNSMAQRVLWHPTPAAKTTTRRAENRTSRAKSATSARSLGSSRFVRKTRYPRSFTARTSPSSVLPASPKSIEVPSRKKSGFSMPA